MNDRTGGINLKALKIIKKALIAVLALFLAFLIAWGCVIMFYYPHYRKNRAQLTIPYSSENADEVKVMSCNVRCFNPLDRGKRSWFYRADLIMRGIKNAAPGVIGFQEVTKPQYNYLTYSLPEYDSVITYRDKTPNSEGCPVFYRTDLYNLVDKGTFWLSETPETMSKGWGAACYRVCSYTILEIKETGKQFVVFNTHLDHVSEEARINGIGVVLEKIKAFGSLPSVIMGDFNAYEDSVTYSRVTENFLDAKYQTENPPVGCTYQNWGAALDTGCIDYFMISKTGMDVKSYKVITDTYDGVYSSDHFPIYTELTVTE